MHLPVKEAEVRQVIKGYDTPHMVERSILKTFMALPGKSLTADRVREITCVFDDCDISPHHIRGSLAKLVRAKVLKSRKGTRGDRTREYLVNGPRQNW